MIQFVCNLCTLKVVQYQSKFGRCQGDLLFSLDSSKEHQADLVKRVGALLLVETKSDLMPGTCLDTCREVAQLSLPDIPDAGQNQESQLEQHFSKSAYIRVFSSNVSKENIKPLTAACHWAGPRT